MQQCCNAISRNYLVYNIESTYINNGVGFTTGTTRFAINFHLIPQSMPGMKDFCCFKQFDEQLKSLLFVPNAKLKITPPVSMLLISGVLPCQHIFTMKQIDTYAVQCYYITRDIHQCECYISILLYQQVRRILLYQQVVEIRLPKSQNLIFLL